MFLNKLLALGWDVGGWMGSNHGFSLIQYDYDQNDYKWLGNPVELTIPANSTFTLDYIFEKAADIDEIVIDEYEVVIGIDAPLGYPIKFKNFLDGEMKDFKRPDKEIYNRLAYRETDRHIYNKCNKKPLSAVFDRLGTNTTVAMVHVQKWMDAYGFALIPAKNTSENKKIIEVYPALLKESKFSAAYQPVRGMLPSEVNEGTDAYDAALCSLMALAYGTGGRLQELPELVGPSCITDEIKEEGWIYYFPTEFIENINSKG